MNGERLAGMPLALHDPVEDDAEFDVRAQLLTLPDADALADDLDAVIDELLAARD